MRRFADKVVIITGTGAGKGEATARRFSGEGACVVLADCAKTKVERVAAAVPADRTFVRVCDVAKHEKVSRLIMRRSGNSERLTPMLASD